MRCDVHLVRRNTTRGRARVGHGEPGRRGKRRGLEPRVGCGSRRPGHVRERAAGRRVPVAFILWCCSRCCRSIGASWSFECSGYSWPAAILVCSTAFAVWVRLALGAMWSPIAAAREGQKLRTTGPYAVTRHPIHTGLIGMLLGTTLLNGNVCLPCLPERRCFGPSPRPRSVCCAGRSVRRTRRY
jgi:hypothetical protein